jgi:hypothetical protein
MPDIWSQWKDRCTWCTFAGSINCLGILIWLQSHKVYHRKEITRS